jgi:hypothetical protein
MRWSVRSWRFASSITVVSSTTAEVDMAGEDKGEFILDDSLEAFERFQAESMRMMENPTPELVAFLASLPPDPPGLIDELEAEMDAEMDDA